MISLISLDIPISITVLISWLNIGAFKNYYVKVACGGL